MKKITLALCACAFALTGLLASCSNEAPSSVNYVNKNSTYSDYQYAVYGTITKTTESEKITDEYGLLDKDGKSQKQSSTSKKTINGGVVEVWWNSNENRTSNYVNYSINGNVTVTGTTGESSWSRDTSASSSKGSGTGREYVSFDIYDVDGTYYINLDGKMVKLDDLAISEDDAAFDGSFGGEFSLNIKITNNNERSISWNDDNKKDNKETLKGDTTTTEYKLTFIPVQDFDPEAAAEAEEE